MTLVEEAVGDGIGEGVTLAFSPRASFDAVRVRIETATGAILEGAEPFFRHPVDAPLPEGVRVTADGGRLTIRLSRKSGAPPGLASVLLRNGAARGFDPVEDADGARLAVALDGVLPNPETALVPLARMLAEPAPAALGGQAERVLGPHYAAAMEAAGSARLIGRIRPVLNLAHTGDRVTARHDLIGVAPWLFQSTPFAFSGIDPHSGLVALGAMGRVAAPDRLPDPRGDAALVDWLDRLRTDVGLPRGLEAEALAHGFRTLRYRLRETDLRLLVAGGPDATAAACIAAVHVEGLERLRDFDHGGGGDDRTARIAAALERFARASALGEAGSLLERLASRTGFPPRECGRILTLMLRAGPEIFAYFRILWHHAALAFPQAVGAGSSHAQGKGAIR